MNTTIEKIRNWVKERKKVLHSTLFNDEYNDFLDTLQEQPVCEGLEEEYKNYVENDPVYSKLVNGIVGLSIARHFAQWGAEHLKKDKNPVSDDLEEAAVEYSAIGYSPFDDPYEKNQQFECSKFAFIAGAKWQMKKDLSSINKSYESGVVFGMNAQKAQSDKELSEKIASAYQLGLADKEKQMMKEAVEGTVMDFSSNRPRPQVDLLLDPHKYHTGDKVHAIIVKEEGK